MGSEAGGGNQDFDAMMEALERYQQFQILNKNLKDSGRQENAEYGNKTTNFNRVSPSEGCNPDNISVPENVEIIPGEWKNKELRGSIFYMLVIYFLVGVVSGMLLKTVFENRIDFMDSLSLISNFTYAKSFMIYMAFVGGVLGLLIGIASAIFIDFVPDPLFLYIPILFMPLLIMVFGPIIMNLAKGTVTLAVIAIQAIPCLGLVYTFFRSFTN